MSPDVPGDKGKTGLTGFTGDTPSAPGGAGIVAPIGAVVKLVGVKVDGWLSPEGRSPGGVRLVVMTTAVLSHQKTY